jgi:hypothetical protein
MRVILAAPDVLVEPELVAEAPRAGVTVVRRCVDAADLMACAAIDADTPIVVGAGVPRMSADLMSRLTAEGRPVIALILTDEDEQRALSWRVPAVIRLMGARETLRAIVDNLREVEPGVPRRAGHDAKRGDDLDPSREPGGSGRDGVWQTGLWSRQAEGTDPGQVHDAADEAGPQAMAAESRVGRRPRRSRVRRPAHDGPGGAPLNGRLIAVWGPPGSPGRTTIAIALSEELSRDGSNILLVDADTYAPSVDLMLGMSQDASGLIVACRHADNGSLSPRSLRSSARSLGNGLHVLGGIPRPERWPDLRPGALAQVWEASRTSFDVTIIDVGACIEAEPSGSISPVLASMRNAAARSALEVADCVLVVGRADALSISRLARGLPAVREAAPCAPQVVAMTQVARPRARWSQVMSTLGAIGVDAPAIQLDLAERRAARRVRAGLTPGESGYAPGERRGVRALARSVLAACERRPTAPPDVDARPGAASAPELWRAS